VVSEPPFPTASVLSLVSPLFSCQGSPEAGPAGPGSVLTPVVYH
jgi:hypothetical protein